MTARAAGTYDPDQLLRDDYLPKVTQKVKELSTASYADRLVYCLYNECDNALWFGESVQDDNPDNPYGVWCDFNDAGKDAFHRGWQATFDAVRAVAPDALIGGPGYSGWNADAVRRFLAFCKENDCLPDVMIYHELGDRTAYYFDDHLAEYRAIEQELGLQPLPVLISEYGMMNETGCPGKMVQYITQMETCKVYGDSAFWRLADNLNDTCADANTPNANWWLYRWYAEMNGETVKATNNDWLSSDFKNSLRDHRALSFRGFMGIASVSEEGVDVVCGGGERRARVVLKGLDAASLKGKRVTVTVEETVYKGIFGAVTAPTVLKTYTVKAGARLSVDLGEIDPMNAYRITVREATGAADYENPDRPARYEFEDGTLHGGAYTYDSYCPASGDTDAADTVGGLENRGDGVTLPFTVPRDGDYLLDFIYGKANDGAPDETGHVSPDDRVSAEALLSIDGASDETVYLPNTIKSEYSSCYTRRVSLTAGAHTVTMRHGGGTYVLDCLVVTAADDAAAPCPVLPDGETGGAAQYLAVVPGDGLYTVTAAGAEALTFNGNTAALDESGAATVYLRRGLNPLTLTGAESAPAVTFDGAGESTRLLPKEAALTGNASVGTQTVGGEACDCLQNLCDGAAATWTFNAPADGVYAVTVTYSNNDENGV
ncbi:MAG: hypothetical protein II738_05340, partial [Clostridia bacterium]|nr:hypothetical protein [Clostridia bacterium]